MNRPSDDDSIAPLVDFEFESDTAFRAAVHRSIDRRITAGEILRMSTVAVGYWFLEVLSLAAQARPSRTPSED